MVKVVFLRVVFVLLMMLVSFGFIVNCLGFLCLNKLMVMLRFLFLGFLNVNLLKLVIVGRFCVFEGVLFGFFYLIIVLFLWVLGFGWLGLIVRVLKKCVNFVCWLGLVGVGFCCGLLLVFIFLLLVFLLVLFLLLFLFLFKLSGLLSNWVLIVM